MKVFTNFIVLILLCIGFSKPLFAQNISNEGTDFWAVFPTHDPSSGQLANMNIFITSKRTSEVTVSCGSYSETKQIPANTVVVFAVPRDVSYIQSSEANTNLTNRGIHIKTTAGMPAVAVYGHVYAGARSAASLILPYDALGQKYYSMNYTQDSNGRNFLVLVAAEDNTKLKLTERNGNVRTITLAKAGDVYEYLAAASVDLTGVYVEVDEATSKCKRFAAFSGSTSLSIQCNNSRDPLFQQLYTTNSWGKIYAVAPFFNRRSIVRILAQEDNTTVNINGTSVTINKGSFYETSTLTEGIIIKADKVVSVAQYSLTQNCSSITGGNVIGDPDMILLNPVEFSITKITLFSSDQQAIQEKYINVVIKTDARATFKVNGALPANGVWRTFTNNPDYSYIQVRVTQQSLTLSADEGFNAIAYGFGNAESYGYSAGTSLAANQYLTVINNTTHEERSNACIGEAADFKITMPYLLNRILWQFDDGTPSYDDHSPAPIIRTVNGETLYDYTAPVNKSYTTAGQRIIKATGFFATDANSCFGSSADFEFVFNVDPTPTANFNVGLRSCFGVEVPFIDASNSNLTDKVIKKWTWDFGDGTAISNEQNPKHIFARPGTFNVKLIVATENGCASEVFTKSVQIFTLPIAKFIAKPSLCEKQSISFESQSTSAEGAIVGWLWDFGDGNTGTGANPAHTYAIAGDYDVKLTVTSEYGCEKSVIQRIKVNVPPKVDFELPDFCLSDGNAIFTNRSTIVSNEQLSYQWDFGDAHANAQNPNISTQRNGSHNYTRTGLYEITLTVKSAAGCAITVKKQFRVNGSIPKAAMEIVNQNALCSNAAVVFKDKATVDFGEITKIEWFFDYANKTTADIVDEPNLRNQPAKEYSYKYPTFSNAASKTYIVKMRVYSGGSCTSEETKSITIYPEAVVDFSLKSSCLTNGIAEFDNLSTYVVSNGNLTYRWHFGDHNTNAQNPNNSTEKAPFHRYTQAGKYTVSLTVTAPYGCAKTVIKEITIDGALPIADFSVQNSNSLCSKNAVVFDDNTTLAFGNITKIEWYYDFANNPTQAETDTSPGTRSSPKSYTHQYPEFSFPFDKTYVVKMVAYAGNNCVATKQQTITLKAVPDIDFAQTMEICLEAPAKQLVAREKNAMIGKAAFNGRGVSIDGFFDPAKAGIGTHEIKYIFAVANGCTVEKIQKITVNETPAVDAGEDKKVLEGGQATLSATAYGQNLRYKWTPATGLDRDDVLNPVVRPTEDMTYTLTVTSDKGCLQKDQVFVKLLKNLEIPNAITPNGDLINDVWNIKYIESYPEATVEIYDRAGQNVFKSKGYAKPFDGTHNNNNLPVGTYYYIINLATAKKPMTGTLTIVK
ncbi:MAG: PKD domain-containing protein [Pedobacter sp.]|uniref:PKD domain-containing protein n=1 Tax=Pedobacter sp. TaxID=1411316 RepID=UPI002806791E|nr:PKD domain-containing protein [Pedobacter sp.]MDQ8004140.1 PKD domain-containing protein [Pedobacter sp.]